MKCFLLCLFCLKSACGEERCGFSERLHYLDSVIAIQPTLHRYEGISRLMCSLNCLEEGNCMSYFFNKLTSVCILHTNVISASAATTASPGEEYYQLLGAEPSTTGARPETTMPTGSSETSSGASSETAGPCPAPHTHIASADMCILVNEQPLKWTHSAAWCRERGDHLLVLNSVHKQILVTQHIIKNYEDDDLGYYMGVRYSSGDWRWENGNKISDDLGSASFYWMSRFPVPVSGGYKFGIMSPLYGGKWTNGVNIKRKSICQRDMN